MLRGRLSNYYLADVIMLIFYTAITQDYRLQLLAGLTAIGGVFAYRRMLTLEVADATFVVVSFQCKPQSEAQPHISEDLHAPQQ